MQSFEHWTASVQGWTGTKKSALAFFGPGGPSPPLYLYIYIYIFFNYITDFYTLKILMFKNF